MGEVSRSIQSVLPAPFTESGSARLSVRSRPPGSSPTGCQRGGDGVRLPSRASRMRALQGGAIREGEIARGLPRQDRGMEQGKGTWRPGEHRLIGAAVARRIRAMFVRLCPMRSVAGFGVGGRLWRGRVSRRVIARARGSQSVHRAAPMAQAAGSRPARRARSLPRPSPE